MATKFTRGSALMLVVAAVLTITVTVQFAPAASTPVEFTVMVPDRELQKRTNALVMDLFNAEMESLGKPWRAKVRIGPARDSEYGTKIAIDAAAGTLADVISAHSAWHIDYVAAGYLLDLTPYVQKWPDWNQYHGVVREQATFDGKVRLIPAITTLTFWYRKDLLRQAGISTAQPKTWNDFYKVLDQIKTKTGKKAVGLPAATPWGGGTFDEGFKLVFHSFDGKLYNEKSGKWVVKSAALLKSLKVYETLAKNGWLTVTELLSPNPWVPIKYVGFPKGEVLIVTGGDWQWEFDWGPRGAAPIEGLFEKVDRWLIPSEKGVPFAYTGIGWATAIYAKSKNPEGAFEWVKFVNRVDIACRSYEVFLAGPSARQDTAARCPYYRSFAGGKMLQAEGFLAEGKYMRLYPGITKIADGIARATEAVITLKMTPEAALVKFAAEMTIALGKENVEIE